MRRFKDLIASKFVWGHKDVEHEKKPKKETKAERSDKFVWRDGDLEHHNIKEGLEENFHLSPDHKGNFAKPHHIPHSEYDWAHPHRKASEPEKGSDAHDEYLSHHENLSGDEEDAVKDYKENGYKAINNYLRGAHKKFKEAKNKHFQQKKKEAIGLKFKDEPEHHKHLKAGNKPVARDHDEEPSDEEYHEHDVEDKIHHLDQVTNFRTPEHHTVYRGGHPGDKTKFPIGHEFTDHGYTSTSFRHETAKGFAHRHAVDEPDKSGYKKLKYHVHVIHVPKGSRGHYFDVMGHDSNHSNTDEHELVLHRGTRFKVTHHSEDENNHYIHSRVVKQGIRHKFKMTSKQKSPEPQPKDDHGLPGQHKFPFMKHHKRFK